MIIKKASGGVGLSASGAILLRASLVMNFGVGLFAPIYALYVEKIGGSILDVGIAYAIFSIVTGTFIILFGTSAFFDRNVRKFVVAGYFLMGLTYLGYLLIESPLHLFIVQIFLGLTNGILEPAWDAVFSAGSNEAQEAKNWSLWSGGVSLIVGFSALLGSYIAHYSFSAIFIIMSACAFISSAISAKILKGRS
ncbi:MAG: hypothetical protein A2946_00800 [Candidatus Liptonbacteria bacterium RIFCSPLOWO2_01_FULL_53_13]|uniref:Major facilitator superfamily (MFS) profile domain-containing protein n=1 Tax=Candidatus Liptonbacteria bacterium RIFCSPLOWO2_01_FULL_53_13 TaxID=1798651 RepID=A0A1G2CIW8_9BACT|nr:MAG: hypothetical protein A2946_00800 [Candidatus Liptonbacteria bacterium RIFCSPLOWO2_01_FULL_53_13]